MGEVIPAGHLTLVIPCYNESMRMPLLAAGLQTFVVQWPSVLEIILVNDGSSDNTGAQLAEMVKSLDGANVRVISQANTGKGGALRAGILQSTSDWVLTLDADMASPPTELLTWFKKGETSVPQPDSIYVGSREHPQSVIRKEESERKLAGNIFNAIVRILTPLRLNDTQCGFKLYPGPAARLLFEPLHTMGWAHDVEVLFRAQRHGMRLHAMPLTWTAVDGSKIRLFRDAARMLLEVMAISRRVRREPLNPQLLVRQQ